MATFQAAAFDAARAARVSAIRADGRRAGICSVPDPLAWFAGTPPVASERLPEAGR